MTHDELLERIDYMKYPVGDSYDMNEESKAIEILRAVVELAATYKDGNYVNEEFNQGLQTAFQLIIEAIEKELK